MPLCFSPYSSPVGWVEVPYSRDRVHSAYFFKKRKQKIEWGLCFCHKCPCLKVLCLLHNSYFFSKYHQTSHNHHVVHAIRCPSCCHSPDPPHIGPVSTAYVVLEVNTFCPSLKLNTNTQRIDAKETGVERQGLALF